MPLLSPANKLDLTLDVEGSKGLLILLDCVISGTFLLRGMHVVANEGQVSRVTQFLGRMYGYLEIVCGDAGHIVVYKIDKVVDHVAYFTRKSLVDFFAEGAPLCFRKIIENCLSGLLGCRDSLLQSFGLALDRPGLFACDLEIDASRDLCFQRSIGRLSIHQSTIIDLIDSQQ